MQIEVTDSPAENDAAFIVAQTRAFNAAFTHTDVKHLCVFARGTDGDIVGGLTGKTYWEYLEVSFLWVHESQRGLGYGTRLLKAAEAEAKARGCGHILLDTFSFQAPDFYTKLGFKEFGRLSGFSGQYDRHYLHKRL